MSDHDTASGQGNRRSGRKRASDEEHLTEEQKSKKQKNRDAAKKCRQRKLEEAKNLKNENENLEKQNKMLTKKKSELENKIENCVRIIRQHESHGCHLPADVKRIMESDSMMLSDQNNSDFCRVGTCTVDDNSTISFRNNESKLESKIPTGLFSGDQLQIDRGKQKKSIVQLQSANQNMMFPDSQMHSQYVSQSSSPVQTVPNIDPLPWSSHSSELDDDEDESEEDGVRRHPLPASGLAAGHSSGGRIVNNPSHSHHDNTGELIINNPSQIYQAHGNADTFNHTQRHVDKSNVTEKNASSSIMPFGLYSNRAKNNQPSVTQSLQATTQLISQAIHDIDPSEMSKALSAQLIEECARHEPEMGHEDKDYLLQNGPNITREMQVEMKQQVEYEIKPQQQEVIPHAHAVTYDSDAQLPMLPGNYSYYGIQNQGNSGYVIVSSSNAVETVLNQQNGFQNNIIPMQGGQQQIIVGSSPVFINPVQLDQVVHFNQYVEEIVQESQIPTTVLNVEDDDESESVMQNNVDYMPLPSTGESVIMMMGNTETGSMSSSSDYSANVMELPSLSFNDLKNQPQEIFDKKPSRLTGQSSK